MIHAADVFICPVTFARKIFGPLGLASCDSFELNYDSANAAVIDGGITGLIVLLSSLLNSVSFGYFQRKLLS
jgi:hypothetical protein